MQEIKQTLQLNTYNLYSMYQKTEIWVYNQEITRVFLYAYNANTIRLQGIYPLCFGVRVRNFTRYLQ